MLSSVLIQPVEKADIISRNNKQIHYLIVNFTFCLFVSLLVLYFMFSL